MNTNTDTTFYSDNNATTAYGAQGWPCGLLTLCAPIACPPVWGLVIEPGDSFTAEAFNAYVQNNDSTSATCLSQDAPQENKTTTCPLTFCCPNKRITACDPDAPDPCCCGTPILIDVTGQGFFLTSVDNGVMFDIRGTGTLEHISWTARGANNAFLALPAADGLVHNCKQLFGNFTPQPSSPDPNGFLALAVYDQPANGRNGDGVIDARDAVFNSLRLWIDKNHDGICQPEELYTLPSLGVNSISLHYTLSRRVDQYGNAFRYRAMVNPDEHVGDVGRWAYDVFFLTEVPSAIQKCPLSPVELPSISGVGK